MMSPTVTGEVTGHAWTLVVDATTSPSRAVTVDRVPATPTAPTAPAVGLADESADDVAAALAPVAGNGDPPGSTIVVVPADTAPGRFDVLAEGVVLAGLPAPVWVPDAVARAGVVLAAGRPHRAHLVVDARADDIEVWGVRPTAVGGRVGPVDPIEVAGDVENLLIAMLRAKLGTSAVHPELSPDAHRDLATCRAAAHLRRDLRRATRALAADRTGHAQIVVTLDEAEVAIGSRELAEALAHAAREGIVAALGAAARAAPAVVVAGADRGLVDHLGAALGAGVVADRPDGAIEGAVALVRARSVTPRRGRRSAAAAGAVRARVISR